MTMNEHVSIQAKLALAAAGALGEDEARQVEQHARECESCRRELAAWGFYAQGLRQLPQPVLPPDLLARTRVRVMRDSPSAVGQPRNGFMFCALAAYSWVIAFAVWLVVRTLTGGTLDIFGTNLVAAGPWMLGSWIVTWITAGAAAVTLGSHRHARRIL